MVEVKGSCDPRFARVADALAASIAAGREIGASLHVSVDGQDVVDLWGGWRDREHSAEWTEDTVVNVFSGAKTVVSVALLMLVDRGLLDLDAPVARYWPEFAQNGKEGVLVRHIMGHTSGVSSWEPPFSLEDALDIPASTARLAAQAPFWPPGTRGTYHASSFGHLTSELFLRASGERLSAFIAREIAGPLRADFFMGLSDADFGRVATVYPAEDEPRPVPPLPDGESSKTPEEIEQDTIASRTRAGSFGSSIKKPFETYNSAAWRRAEIAGSSAHASGRGLGRIMTALAAGGVSRGVRLLTPGTIAQIFREQANGLDLYYRKPIRWGIGYALASEQSNSKGPLPFLQPGPRTCFWYGTGGSLGLADVERGVAIGYAMNLCQTGRNQPNGLYYKAIYECL